MWWGYNGYQYPGSRGGVTPDDAFVLVIFMGLSLQAQAWSYRYFGGRQKEKRRNMSKGGHSFPLRTALLQ